MPLDSPSLSFRFLLSTALLSVAVAACGWTAEEAEGLPNREWFVVEEHGKRLARGTVVRRERAVERGLTVETVEERETRREREGLLYESRDRIRTLTFADGRALSRERTTVSGNTRQTETVTVDERRTSARIDTNLPGRPPRRRVDVPVDLRFDIDAYQVPVMVRARGLTVTVGVKLTSPILDLTDGKVVAETVTVRAVTLWAGLPEAPSPPPSPEIHPPDVPVADALSQADGRDPVRMIFTLAGRLLWMGRPDGALAWRAVAKNEYEEPFAPLEVVTRLLHGGYLPAWDGYDEWVFTLEPAERWRGLVPARNAYGELREGLPGMPLTVVLSAPDDATGKRNATAEDRDAGALDRWRGATERYPSNHPAVVRAAREADAFRGAPETADQPEESGELARLRRLAGWVRRSIGARNQGRMVLGPVETLAARKGHCGEHARLLIALCRYWGLPARLCQGLTVRTEELVYHAWAEVWVDGRWLPVDTTAGLIGFRAGYWLTARETPEGELADPLPRAMQSGGIALRWLSAGVADPDGGWHHWRQEDSAPPIVRKGEGAFDLGWGMGLWRPPAGWRFRLPSGVVPPPDDSSGATAARWPRTGNWRAGATLSWTAGEGGAAYALTAWPGTFVIDGFTAARQAGVMQRELDRFRKDTAVLDEWPGERGGAAVRVDGRWRTAERAAVWARQYDLPLPERKLRASYHGYDQADYAGAVGRRLFETTRLR